MLVLRRVGLQGLRLRGALGLGVKGFWGVGGVGDSEVFGSLSTGLQD